MDACAWTRTDVVRPWRRRMSTTRRSRWELGQPGAASQVAILQQPDGGAGLPEHRLVGFACSSTSSCREHGQYINYYTANKKRSATTTLIAPCGRIGSRPDRQDALLPASPAFPGVPVIAGGRGEPSTPAALRLLERHRHAVSIPARLQGRPQRGLDNGVQPISVEIARRLASEDRPQPPRNARHRLRAGSWRTGSSPARSSVPRPRNQGRPGHVAAKATRIIHQETNPPIARPSRHHDQAVVANPPSKAISEEDMDRPRRPVRRPHPMEAVEKILAFTP